MKRPSEFKNSIIEFSAVDWTEKKAAQYPDLIGVSEHEKQHFAEMLAAAACACLGRGPDELASKLGRRLDGSTTRELIDAMDDYASHHARIYADTVEKWMGACGPAQPFEDFARVEVGARPVAGIGVISERYRKSGQFLFRPDGSAPPEADGRVRSWEIHCWEDVVRVEPPSSADVETMERHRNAEAAMEARHASLRRAQMALGRLAAMVKSHDGMTAAEAEAVFRDVAEGDPEKAARLIKALSVGASAALLAARDEETPAPRLGMLL